MNPRLQAALIVFLAATLGWFWRIAEERGLPADLFGVAAYSLLVAWLWNRLDRKGDA